MKIQVCVQFIEKKRQKYDVLWCPQNEMNKS